MNNKKTLVVLAIVAALILASLIGFVLMNKLINGNTKESEQINLIEIDQQLKSQQIKINELKSTVDNQLIINNEQAALNKKLIAGLQEQKTDKDLQTALSNLQSAFELQQQKLLIVEQAITDIKAAASKPIAKKVTRRAISKKPVNAVIKLPFVISRIEVWNNKPVVIVNNNRLSVGDNYAAYKLISVNRDQTTWQNIENGKTIVGEVQQ